MKEKKKKIISSNSPESLESAWDTGVWRNTTNKRNIVVGVGGYLSLWFVFPALFTLISAILTLPLMVFLYEIGSYEKKQKNYSQDQSHMWGTHREYFFKGIRDYDSSFKETFNFELKLDYLIAMIAPAVIVLKMIFYRESRELLNNFVKFRGKYYFFPDGEESEHIHEISSSYTLKPFMDFFRVADEDDIHATLIKENSDEKNNSMEDQPTFDGLFMGLFAKKKRFQSQFSRIVDRMIDGTPFEDLVSAVGYFEKTFSRELTPEEIVLIKKLHNRSEKTLELDRIPLKQKETNRR